jgi:hypothetical protein
LLLPDPDNGCRPLSPGSAGCSRRIAEWQSDPQDLYRGESGEVGVLGDDRGSVPESGGCDPRVVAAESSTGTELLVGDPREARGRGVIDAQQRVLGAHARQRRRTYCAGLLVSRAQDTKLELGRRDDTWTV